MVEGLIDNYFRGKIIWAGEQLLLEHERNLIYSMLSQKIQPELICRNYKERNCSSKKEDLINNYICSKTT